MLGRPYGSENPTASGVLGASELRNDAIMYSVNAPSRTLRYSKGVKVEYDLQIL